MTISTDPIKNTRVGNGTATEFSFTFRLLRASDLQVLVREIATGTLQKLTSSAYSVTIAEDGVGGTVSYPLAGSPLESTHEIIMLLNMAYEQPIELSNQTRYYANVVMEGLDRLTLLTKQLDERVGRALLIPIGEATSTLTQLVEGILRLNSSADNIDIVATGIADVNLVASLESEINTLSAISDAIVAVEGNATAISAVSGITAEIAVTANNIAAILAAPSEAEAAAQSATDAETAAAQAVNRVAKTSDTGAAVLPAGTTAQRDGSPLAGYLRWSLTEGAAEIYDGTAWVAVGGAGGGLFKANTISDLAGTGPVTLTGQSAAKAWIHYDQSPSTIIGDSFNVDSITDLGTGNQIVAYTSVFSNARYAGAATSRGVGNVAWQSAPLVGSVNVQTVATNTGALHDYNHVCVTWHGDLA